MKSLGRFVEIRPFCRNSTFFCPNDSQLWIDRVCRVNLAFNSTICDNLNSNPAFQDFENQVQQQVAEFNIIGSYIENVPTIFISLYLGIYRRSWV